MNLLAHCPEIWCPNIVFMELIFCIDDSSQHRLSAENIMISGAETNLGESTLNTSQRVQCSSVNIEMLASSHSL